MDSKLLILCCLCVTAMASHVIRLKCESRNFNHAMCDAKPPITHIVGVHHQQSVSACTEDVSYGLNSDGTLWVDHGCRADFNVQFSSLVNGEKKCESWNYARAVCEAPWPVAFIIGVKRKESNSACTEGVSYGLEAGNIWVDKGCRAVFNVQHLRPVQETLNCASWNYKRATCQLSKTITDVVRVERRDSKSACQEGHSYGVDVGKLWVDHGCRALFQVQV